MVDNPIIPSNKFQDPIFNVPHDIVKLPSEAKLYAGQIPDTIEVEYMTAKAENILYSNVLMENGIVFDTLVKQQIKDKTINVDNLLIGDFNEILIFLRKTMLGNEYQLNVLDPDVGLIKKTILLDSLKRKSLTEPFNEKGEFEFILPVMNKKITFKLMTVGMGNLINNTAESQKDGITGVIPYITTSLKKQITSVDGDRDLIYVEKFVDVMNTKDRLEFVKYADKIAPGVVLDYEFESEIKKIKYIQKINLAADFFYPTLSNK